MRFAKKHSAGAQTFDRSRWSSQVNAVNKINQQKEEKIFNDYEQVSAG
jgi:hypothetical protein